MPQPLNIVLMAGKHAGVLAALALLARGHHVTAAVGYSDDVRALLRDCGITVYENIKSPGFEEALKRSSALLCVHGREIVPARLIAMPKLGAFNVHPYLSKYKGADPIKRALADRNWHASVGAHYMTEKVDEGQVVVEEFSDIAPAVSVEEIYNRLYPVYAEVILKLIRHWEEKS